MSEKHSSVDEQMSKVYMGSSIENGKNDNNEDNKHSEVQSTQSKVLSKGSVIIQTSDGINDSEEIKNGENNHLNEIQKMFSYDNHESGSVNKPQKDSSLEQITTKDSSDDEKTFNSNEKKYYLDFDRYSKIFDKLNEGFNLILYFMEIERDSLSNILVIVRNLKNNNRNKVIKNRETIDNELSMNKAYEAELNNLLNGSKLKEKVKVFITSSVKIRGQLFTLMRSFVTGSNTKKRKDQVKQLESDCQEVKQFLVKYFDQVQHATKNLKQISSNTEKDTIVLVMKTWNDEICNLMKYIKVLFSEIFKNIKRKEIVDLVKQFNTECNGVFEFLKFTVPEI